MQTVRIELTVKRPFVRHVIDQQDAHGAAVIRRRDGPEPLLPGRVPDLQLDALAIQLDRSDLEVDPDGGDEGRCEGILAESEQAAGFAHARVANEQELDLFGPSVIREISCSSWFPAVSSRDRDFAQGCGMNMNGLRHGRAGLRWA